MTEITRELRIINEKGLHARASAKFVETVERFDARATVEKDGCLLYTSPSPRD